MPTTAFKTTNTHLRVVGRKNYINKNAILEPITEFLFVDFIRGIVSRKIHRNGESYRRVYNTLILQLNDFADLYEVDIFTNSINEEFLIDFIAYLEWKQLSRNYIKNLLSLTKSMVAKAGKYNYAIDTTYLEVDYIGEVPQSVYLTMNEITRIYYFKGLTPKQERIRDLFVVGCLTGLRHSDYSTLTRDNFNGNYIVKITKKTNSKVQIPLHGYVKEIYRKYDGQISNGVGIQHFNRYIKKVCRQVGLIDPITFSYTRGGKIVTETKQKWELISSHTARRYAATNMYLTGRMKTYQIMKITGHTTERSFFRYIKITQEDSVKQVAGDSFWNI
jgi:integrase